MSDFWNARFKDEEYYYGVEPNEFYKSVIDAMPVGKLWVPGAGEGRDAVYAATIGWESYAFDASEMGMGKAMQLAQSKNVSINYACMDAADVDASPNTFNAIAMIYFHLPMPLRRIFHSKCVAALKPGGIIIIEAFHPLQLKNTSGGPKDIGLLYTLEDLKQDFTDLDIVIAKQEQIHLNEGKHHVGLADVVRCVFKKKQ